MLNDNLRGEGSFYRCWHLARALVRAGHEVCLITVSRNRRILPRGEFSGGLRLLESPNLLDLVYGLGPGYGIVGIPYRMVIAARNRFDVVHAFESSPNVLLPAMFSRALNRHPLVVDWSDWWGFSRDGSGLYERRRWPAPQLANAMEEFFHRKADWVTTISTGLKDRAVALGIPPGRVRWIPSGAPADTITPLDINVCRRELGIPSSTYLVGYVGSQVGDVGMLSPAFQVLRRAHPHVKIGVIGPPPSALRDFHDAAIPFGPVPFSRLPVFLGACNSFALPLRGTVFNRTRWPNKFGDYLAAGRPILCSNVGDVARIVESEGCGLVWTDLSEFVDGIEFLMNNKESADSMAKASRDVAEGRLSWERLAAEFLTIYQHAAAHV